MTSPGQTTQTNRRGPKPKPHTRENLIRVGMEMFHQGGYTATGIQDIVAAAQVPKGSFYNYFESKEAFGKEVIDAYFDNGLSTLATLLRDESLPPIERLRRFFEEKIQLFKQLDYSRGCMLGNFSLEVADRIPSIRDCLAAHFDTWSRLFEACITEAQRAGTMNNALPAALLAQFLLNSWEGALLRMRTQKSDAPLNEFVEVVFKTLLI